VWLAGYRPIRLRRKIADIDGMDVSGRSRMTAQRSLSEIAGAVSGR